MVTNYTVVLIQIGHNFFLRDKGKHYRRNGKGGLFRMVTLQLKHDCLVGAPETSAPPAGCRSLLRTQKKGLQSR